MTAYEMRISDWSSDVCSSDLVERGVYAGDREEIEASAEIRIAAHRRPDYRRELQLADGRYVQIVERSVPDGSTVCVWTDITDLRRHENETGRASCRERVCQYV